MNTESWAKIEEIVSRALTVDGDEREKYVNVQCEKHPTLKDEIVSLLQMENEADGFFDSPAVFQYASIIDDTNVESSVGRQIGKYQIVKEIGTGGMGAVYLATRIDGNLEQQVAIKMLRREFNTKEIRQRFENEKEIQSTLNHPNIAHLIDAGTTKDSIPFLVMEFIEGESISKYAEQANLSLNERLKLFNKICDAVAFAHRNLVIHRDLKPSNILVTKNGEPKLLDFGISKLLSNKGNQTQTVTKMGVMTPEYASPEQAKGESVTTATDIYSLGVLLFELLTGHRPFEKEFQDKGNVFKAIIESEPERPSVVLIRIQSSNIPDGDTFLKPSNVGDSSDEANTKIIEQAKTKELINQTQQIFAITNPKLIKGDLDNIILKALRKEPNRRYQTVEQFSSDIWRHLDGMPVSARPATFNYRASKFITRNKVGVFASGLVLLAIIGGLFTTLWQARRAETQRVKAEKRFNDVRSLATSILFDVYPTVEKLEGSIEARKKIVDNAIKYLDSLSGEALGNTELQMELAEAYMKVGDVQGNNKHPNLGDMKGSLESYQKARALVESVYLNDSNNLEVKNNLAKVLEDEAFVLWWMGDNPKTYERFDEAIKLRKELIKSNPKSNEYKFALADLYLHYGDVPLWENKLDEANENYQIAHKSLKELVEENPDNLDMKARYSYSFGRLSQVDTRSKSFADSLTKLERAEKIAREVVEEKPKDSKFQENLWGTQFSICEVYIAKKDASNSIKSCETVVKTQRKLVELEPSNITAKYNLSNSYSYLGRGFLLANQFDKAINALDKSIENLDIILTENPKNIGYRQERLISLNSKGTLYLRQKKYGLATETYEKVAKGYEELLQENPNDPRSKLNLYKTYSDLGDVLLTQNKKVQAKIVLEKSLKIGIKLLTEKSLNKLDQESLEKTRANLNKLK